MNFSRKNKKSKYLISQDNGEDYFKEKELFQL